jgi:hypothetical protein
MIGASQYGSFGGTARRMVALALVTGVACWLAASKPAQAQAQSGIPGRIAAAGKVRVCIWPELVWTRCRHSQMVAFRASQDRLAAVPALSDKQWLLLAKGEHHRNGSDKHSTSVRSVSIAKWFTQVVDCSSFCRVQPRREGRTCVVVGGPLNCSGKYL